jgi:D-alanyl-D-alanine carboxypeptidase/D-alanyl-D-alanine-endopeptidase (penicillin-binding protein 4)
MVDDSLFTGPTTAPDWPESLLSTCLVRPIMALMVNSGMSPEEIPCEPEADPALAAGRTFARLLAAEGVSVTGEVGRRRAETAPELASVQSPPMSELVEQTLLRSDNTAAETLAHLAGGKLTGEASFVGGAAATDQVLRGLGLSTAGLKLSDGSGLSRENRIPPLLVGQTLARVAANANPQLWPVGSGLPVAGFDGTLASRFDTAATLPGRGEVRAKTGTLTEVGALAGWVVDQSGRLLIFDFVSDKVADTEEGRVALDRAASALANCGCAGAPN